MPRNTIKDMEEEKRRKQQLLHAAFELFCQNGIEVVKLSDIALKANVGIATLYKYYRNKVNLVIEVSANVWTKTIQEFLLVHSVDELRTYDARQLIEEYLNRIIYIYNEHPELLRFSGNFKSYISRQGVSDEELLVHTQTMDILKEIFHPKYVEAQTTGCIRTDIDEKEIFFMFTLTMLSMGERYASGLVWADVNKDNHTKELIRIKEMILNWCSNGESNV